MTDCDEIIATLRAHQAELEELGLRHAALFGSWSRDKEREASNIDVAIEIDMPPHEKSVTTWRDAVQRRKKLWMILGRDVEISDGSMMRDCVRDDFERDKIDAF